MKIFDELSYAKNLLEKGFDENRFSTDLLILAKYYRYLEYKEKQIKKSLIDFCIQFDPYFNLVLNDESLRNAVINSREYKLVLPVDVPITEHELESIKKLDNFRYEKVLFVMLVVAKYFKLTRKHNKEEKDFDDGKYRENLSFSTIYRLAHIAEKPGENIKHKLSELGFADPGNIRPESIRLNFTDTNDKSEIKIIVTDMNNIISFYPIYCSWCGKILTEKIIGRKSMHEECAKEKNIKNNKERHY